MAALLHMGRMICKGPDIMTGPGSGLRMHVRVSSFR